MRRSYKIISHTMFYFTLREPTTSIDEAVQEMILSMSKDRSVSDKVKLWIYRLHGTDTYARRVAKERDMEIEQQLNLDFVSGPHGLYRGPKLVAPERMRSDR